MTDSIRSLLLGPILLLSLAGTALAQGDAATEAADDATAPARLMLEGLFDDVYELVQSDLDDDSKRLALAHLLARNLDTGALARTALGPLAERFTREEYADFAHEFSRFICWTLAGRVAGADRKAEIVAARLDEASGRVAVEALGGDFRPLWRRQRTIPGRTKLDLGLRSVYGEWRIAAIRIDGVDVAQNYRAQFESLLRSSEPADIIEDLRERNRKSETEAK